MTASNSGLILGGQGRFGRAAARAFDALRASLRPTRQAEDPGAWLLRLACLLTGTALLTVMALALDERRLGLDSVWLKPLEFQLALAVQSATLAWGPRRLAPLYAAAALPRPLAWLWIAVVSYEAAYITLQGARGTTSHFNRGTAWEGVAGTLMATGAGVLVTVTLWIGLVALWQSWRERARSPMVLAIGLGFVLGAVLAAWTGSAIGALRGYWPQPLVEPLLRLPVTGWVLSQPDLRIAHFIGLHQMQLLPAVKAFAAARRWPRSVAVAALAVTSLGATALCWHLVQS